jgi:hypothetical protein
MQVYLNESSISSWHVLFSSTNASRTDFPATSQQQFTCVSDTDISLDCTYTLFDTNVNTDTASGFTFGNTMVPLRSNPIHDMADFTTPGGNLRYTSQGPVDHQNRTLYEESSSGSSPDNFAHISTSASVEMAFAPWLLEASSYDSPQSRTSSVSGSEYISTPPYVDLEQSDIHHLTQQAHLLSMDYMRRDPSYVNNQQLTWPSPLTRNGGVPFRQPHSQSTIAVWHQSSYDSSSMPVSEYYASSFGSNATSSLLQSTPGCQPIYQSPNVTICKLSDSDSTATDSHGDDSDYEDCSTDYSQNEATRSSSGPKTKASTTTPVLRLGKWSMAVDPFSQPAQRLYVCPLADKSGAVGRRCDQSFARPEHLRRHMKTVHGNERNYRCKLPQCEKAFSRGDNLRDHYWTHIQRGGRVGKNDKMSLAELKDFLGPKEKKLIKKLKQKLSNQRMKQRCKL